jgi:hypothetical protein
MNGLIIYYSLTGTNKQVSINQSVKNGFELLEFAPGGFTRVFNLFWNKGLWLRAKELKINDYNNLIINGPIWGGKPAPAIRALIESLDLKNRKVSVNLTHTGDPGNSSEYINKVLSDKGAKINGVSVKLVTDN